MQHDRYNLQNFFFYKEYHRQHHQLWNHIHFWKLLCSGSSVNSQTCSNSHRSSLPITGGHLTLWVTRSVISPAQPQTQLVYNHIIKWMQECRENHKAIRFGSDSHEPSHRDHLFHCKCSLLLFLLLHYSQSTSRRHLQYLSYHTIIPPCNTISKEFTTFCTVLMVIGRNSYCAYDNKLLCPSIKLN